MHPSKSRLPRKAALLSLLVATAGLAACESRRSRQPVSADTVVAEPVSLGLQFSEDDARTFEELHDSYQGFVRYFDSNETPPVLAKVPGKISAGQPVVIGAVRRLPKVQVGLKLLQGNDTTFICESGVVNLAKTLAREVAIPASCQRIDKDGTLHPVEAKPVVVVIRETLDVAVKPDGAKATEKAAALATSTALVLRQEGTYAGTPASFELMFSPNPGRNEPLVTAQLVVSAKADGKTLVTLKNGAITLADLLKFLSGAKAEGLLLEGMAEVQAHRRDASELAPLSLPAQLALKSPRGAEWVLSGQNRNMRMAFVAEFTTVDGTGPESAAPFSGELILRDETPAPATITVATYNVEGMSDDVGAGFPYDFSNASSNWVKDKMYEVKAQHIAEALALADTPDVVAMQEIKYLDGKGRPIQILAPYLEKLGYKYYAFGPQRPKGARGFTPSDTQAVVSKYPIVRVESLPFDSEDAAGAARDPLVVTIDVNGNLLRLYTVHTRSKRSERTPADQALGDGLRRGMLEVVRKDIDKVRDENLNLDIVVTGDMNADYFETPIRDGLGTTGNEDRMLKNGNDEKALYELWYDLKPDERCGSAVGGKRQCIDHIQVSSSLYDNHGFQYVDNSFRLVGSSGLAREKLVGPDGRGFRWQTRETTTVVGGQNRTYTTHVGQGYSDHLPIVATFRVLGQTNDTSRAPLAGPASEQIDHTASNTLVHIRNCTDNAGEFLPSETPVELSTNLDFSKGEFMHKCFRLANGNIPIKVVDSYDTRNDWGFEFASRSPFFKAVSVTVQYGDQNPGGRVIDRNAIMAQFATTVQSALAAGKSVSLTSFKGRLGMSYGKLTLFAEELPGLMVTEPATPAPVP